MQKVKLFRAIESEVNSLENEINEWIVASGARIISVTGNVAPHRSDGGALGTFSASDVLIIILYEESHAS